ncbi:MAG: proline--tRNA ligase [Actinomycetota bacterium]
MRFSKFYIPTLKEEPSSSEIKSHALSLRAGLVRKVAAGIYAYLPLGLKVLRKIEDIVREEMNRAEAIELVLSIMQPSDLWEKSGRWNQYGPEMFRLKDRNERNFCLGPTHEELITYLAYLDIKSYKELPINLYQIHVKFRDEIRPRYGILRAREFIMKDAYSFCRNEEELEQIYQKMYQAYCRITERLGLEYMVVEADTGLIGGKVSHEFIIMAEDGEEVVVQCSCGYSAKQENARFRPAGVKKEEPKDLKKIHTPGAKTIEEVSDFLKVPVTGIVKSMVLNGEDGKLYAFLLSGERELDLERAAGAAKTPLALIQDQDLAGELNLGFFGPVGPAKEVKIFSDYSIEGKSNLAVGANQKDYHYINANYPRDFSTGQWGNFSYPVKGDLCGECGNELDFKKGIEIGHIFKLGEKYSKALEAKFLDEDGKQKTFQMGCYGIGISRIMSASIEQLSDRDRIVWPESIAPFKAIIIATNTQDSKIRDAADKIYRMLLDLGVDVLYDDRNVRAGVKFKDADLIGIPLRLIIGKNYLAKGLIEAEFSKDGAKKEVALKDIPEFLDNFKH